MTGLIKSIVHGSVWLITSNFLTKALHAVLAIILIRGLGVDDYGFLMTLWGVGALLAGGLDLGMSQTLLREGARDHSLIRSFINYILAIRIPLSILVIIAVITIKYTMIDYIYVQKYFPTLALLVLIAFVPVVDSWHFPFAFLCHIFNRFKAVSIYRTLYLGSVVAAIIVCVHFTHSVELVSLVYAIITLVAILFFCKYAYRLIPKETQNNVRFKSAVKQSVPFFAINMIKMAYMRIELLLLSALLTTYEAGIYCAQYQIVVLFFMVPALVYMTLMPTLYKRHRDLTFLKRVYTDCFRYLNLYAVIAIPFIIYMSEELMVIVGGEALRQHSSGLRLLSFMLLFLFTGLSVNFLNVLDLLNKRIKYESIGIGLLTIAGLVVIPAYKINGIAIVAAVSYGLTGVLAFSCLVRHGIVDLKPVFKNLFKIALAAAISSSVFFYGTHLKLLNVAIYIGLIMILSFIFKLWREIDYRILGQVKTFIMNKDEQVHP